MNTETQLTIVSVSEAERDQQPPHSLLLRPAGAVEDIVNSWLNYQDLKSKLLDSSDWQNISGRNCIKKSGWRKLQTAFAISDELIKEERKEYNDYFTFETTVRVAASNGRYSFGVGSCSSNERRFAHPEHDVRSTAHTRAKNRAISDLIGGGEVSAEEMVTTEVESRAPFCENNEEQVSHIETLIGRQQDEQSGRRYDQQTITERQKKYLISLINAQALNREDRDERYAELETLTKYEASNLIQELSMAV